MINKISADLIREYVLDHYVHYGFLPSDVEVEETIFDYKTYNKIIDLFFPDFHKIATQKRIQKLKGLKNDY
tara:strand:+ start:218 stop:430 length:213 start_codon:yes stop_codon:yes gene_type:complete